MDVFEATKKRRSVRNFKEKEIPKDFEEKLSQALIWGPSAGNLQSRKFYFVKRKELKEKVAKAAVGQNFIALAPIVVVGCADLNIEKFYRQRGKEIYAICEAAVSLQNMMLVATSLGLGTCWVGAFEENEIKKALDIPDYLRPIAIVPVGFPDSIPPAPERKSKEEIIKKK